MLRGEQLLQMCQLCGKRPVIGQEHLPLRAVSNLGEISINYIDGNDKDNKIKYRTVQSSDGFWVPALCKKCNNKTGYRYGDSYKHFVTQISESTGIVDSKGRVLINLKSVYPTRILKQMFSMFLCAVPFEPTPKWRGIQEFVLKRDSSLTSKAPCVYIYMNISKIGRIVPCCCIGEFSTHKGIVVSEISWPPLGIVFSFQSDERFALMEDITNWGRQFSFKDKKDIIIHLPRLQVSTHYPLGFGTIEQVEREIDSRLPLYLFHIPDNSASPTRFGVLFKGCT